MSITTTAPYISSEAAIFYQRGESLDFVNSGNDAIPANTIIGLCERIGVAGTEIKPGETGSVMVAGTYVLPKSSSNAIEIGVAVYFDGDGITETSTNNVPAGFAAAAAKAADDTILVKIG